MSASLNRVLERQHAIEKLLNSTLHQLGDRFTAQRTALEKRHAAQLHNFTTVLLGLLRTQVEEPFNRLRSEMEALEDARIGNRLRRAWCRLRGKPYERRWVGPVVEIDYAAVEQRVIRSLSATFKTEDPPMPEPHDAPRPMSSMVG